VWDTRTLLLNYDGTLWYDVAIDLTDPATDDRTLVTKGYVDALTGGDGLNTVAQNIYGGTVLYNNASGIGNGAAATLSGSVQDFYQVEVVGETNGATNVRYAVHISTATITDEGASAVWAVVDKPGGGDNGGLGIKFDTNTDISGQGYGDNFGNFRITKVTGYFPKNAGGA
jgi:hypothetical protein